MPAFAPRLGSSSTYIWRATDNMAEIAGTLPVTVELMEGHTVDDVNGLSSPSPPPELLLKI